MSDHWRDQPREPAGSEEGGRWTEAEREARKAALPAKSYRISGNRKIYVIKGNDYLPNEVWEMLDDDSKYGTTRPVIYNAETGNWHIGGHWDLVHLDFEEEALEGINPKFNEAVIARGTIHKTGLEMWDIRNMAGELVEGIFTIDRIMAILNRVAEKVGKNVFRYPDGSEVPIMWTPLDEVMYGY